MRIVVFGAGGCVGGWVCEHFASNPDNHVVASIRSWSSAVRVARRGLELARHDLASEADLGPLLAGADVVVNASMPPPELEAPTAGRLFAAARQAKVRRVIQFSSAAVYGDREGRVDESDIPAPIDGYGQGKASMESALLELATREGPQLVILRPSIVYGPFGDAWTVRYARRIHRGRWQNLGSAGTGLCNLIYAGDVARAVEAASLADMPMGPHVLNLNNPEEVSWNEYIDLFGRALGVEDRVAVSGPAFAATSMFTECIRTGGGWVKRNAAATFARLSRSRGAGRALFGGAKALADLYPSLGELKLLRRNAYYQAERIQDVLEFTPATTLKAGLERSAQWCKLHGVAV